MPLNGLTDLGIAVISIGVVVSEFRSYLLLKLEQSEKHQAPQRALNQYSNNEPNSRRRQPTVEDHKSNISSCQMKQKQNWKIDEHEQRDQYIRNQVRRPTQRNGPRIPKTQRLCLIYHANTG
jgi:hypothetical protein